MNDQPLWERVKELEEATQAPQLIPAIKATPTDIEDDVAYHGCAYVVDTPQGFYLAHPNNVTVYGEPKLRK